MRTKLLIPIIIVAVFFNASFVFAEETPTSTPEPTLTPTTESTLTPTPEPTPSPTPESTPTPSPSETPTPEPTPSVTPSEETPTPSATPTPEATPTPTVTPLPSATPISTPTPANTPIPQPTPVPTPVVTPVVPFRGTDGRGFDPKTAPSKVKIRIKTVKGEVPQIPVFITFVGVGGKTYGGPINKDGLLETVMPTGRYYTDILVIDTHWGPPADPPSFFLEANEERDFGVLILSDNSSFTDPFLEAEVTKSLDNGSPQGFGKVLSLVVKILLEILKEIRLLRSDLAGK